MTTRDAITHLLDHHHEITAFNSQSGSGTGTGTIELPYAYKHSSLAQLEQTLRQMRKHGNQQAINGIPLRTLWWHLTQHYIECTWTVRPTVTGWAVANETRYVPAAWHHGNVIAGHTVGRGKKAPITRPERHRHVHRDVRQDRVDLALDWAARYMDEHYGGCHIAKEQVAA